MTVPTIFEGISDQPEATTLDGLFFAAESVNPSDPTVKVPLDLIKNSISGTNLISNSSFETAGSVANPPDATPKNYINGDELFAGVFSDGASFGVAYANGILNGTGQLYTDVYKSEKQKDSTSDFTPSIAGSNGNPYETGATVVDNGDYWRVTFDMTNTFSVKLEQGNVATRHDFEIKQQTTDKYVPSENINTTALPVALEKNQVGANQDRWVMLFGDSHGWGQGAPDWDTFSGSVNFSTHSSFPHSKGFMRRIEDFLRDKLQINENTFNLGHPDVSGRIQPMDPSSGFMLDIEKSYPLKLQSGFLTSTQTDLVDVTGNTISEFYNPLAKFNTDNYSLTEYREKLSTSMFKDMLMKLRIETDDEFLTAGKDYFVDMIPDPSYTGSGGTHTQITFGSESVIFAEYNNSSGAFFLVSKSTSNSPNWFAVGSLAYLPGYGIIKIASILGNGAIQVTNEDGSQIGASGAGYITTRTRLYHPSYVKTAILRAEMVTPARVSYIHVRHQSNGANLRIAFTNSVSGGLALHPYLNEGVQFRGSANKWNPKFSDFNPSVSLVGPGHILSTASKVSTDTQGVSIDTSQITPSVDEEVIYRIDWGSKQQGALHLSCVEQTPGDGTSVETRGIVFDNNKVVNHSMGGHTVGAWIGQQSNTGNTETRDHVNDILNYTPVRPSHVIVQIPFVNEYLKQTSIVDFSNYLQSFVDKFINHMATTNNYNLVGTDFLFFTSLRNKEIGFEGAAESAITYDDYVQATKEFCSDNDHAFVDCEQRLFDLVDQGRIDYQRLYNDSNHPSDYANEMIFEALKGEFIYAQMG